MLFGCQLVELAAVKIEHYDLREKVWLIEDERHNFEERYIVPTGEKSATEDLTSLDGEVGHLLQQVRDLVVGKEALEVRMRQ